MVSALGAVGSVNVNWGGSREGGTCFKCTGLRKILAWNPPEAHLGIRRSMLRFQPISQSLCVLGNSTSSVVVLGRSLMGSNWVLGAELLVKD